MEFDAQELINSGMAWRMEGSIGRACMAAIESGECILGEEGHYDYYGNYVPSRHEVQPGTKGSLEYSQRMKDELRGPLMERAQTHSVVRGARSSSWDRKNQRDLRALRRRR